VKETAAHDDENFTWFPIPEIKRKLDRRASKEQVQSTGRPIEGLDAQDNENWRWLPDVEVVHDRYRQDPAEDVPAKAAGRSAGSLPQDEQHSTREASSGQAERTGQTLPGVDVQDNENWWFIFNNHIPMVLMDHRKRQILSRQDDVRPEQVDDSVSQDPARSPSDRGGPGEAELQDSELWSWFPVPEVVHSRKGNARRDGASRFRRVRKHTVRHLGGRGLAASGRPGDSSARL
jgi:hypothetical protein